MYNTPEKRRNYLKKYRELNREKLNKDKKLYYQENKERFKEYAKKRFVGYKSKHRENTLKIRYGIDSIRYEELLSEQKGVCAICLKPETARHQSGTIRKLAVDHCHKTGLVRGLLCSKCNPAIGYFEHNTDRLERAKTYLLKHKNDIITRIKNK